MQRDVRKGFRVEHLSVHVIKNGLRNGLSEIHSKKKKKKQKENVGCVK